MTRDRSKDVEFLDMPWPIAVLALLSACLTLTVFGGRIVYKHYRVPSAAMQPALSPGDYFIANKFAYWNERPVRRGDMIVFRPETAPDRDFVSRVVGVGGDRVQMIDGVVHLNGRAITSARTGEMAFADFGEGAVEYNVAMETGDGNVRYSVLSLDSTPGDDTQIYQVPPDAYFVLGDNRDNSADSRDEMGGYGFVLQRSVLGKVVYVLPRDTPAPMLLEAMRPF